MKQAAKKLIKSLAGPIKIETIERLLASSILEQDYRQVASLPVFANREALWSSVLAAEAKPDDSLTYVEFGVFQGASIRFFAGNNRHPDSRFIGLDSFEGLPEDWDSKPKGTFSVNGSIPQIDDARVSFIKGWFQDSWAELESRVRPVVTKNLIVHYDADLYSSTLFALGKIDTLGVRYVAIFDEFAGHETRALYNYCQAYGATVSFLGKTLWQNQHPDQVACIITPRAVANAR